MNIPIWMATWSVAVALAWTGSDLRAANAPEGSWYTVKNGQVQVHLYVFVSETCPHCTQAKSFVWALQQRHDWLNVPMYEVSHSGNRDFYRRMAESLKTTTAGQVPAFFYCKRLTIGFEGTDTTGKRLEEGLTRCREALQKQLDERLKERQPPLGMRPERTARFALCLTCLSGPIPEGESDPEEDLLPPDFELELPPPEEEMRSIPVHALC